MIPTRSNGLTSSTGSRTMPSNSARAALGAVLAAGAITALAGCGAGQVNTIGDEVAAVNGATGHLQNVDVVNTSIAAPPGEAHAYQPGQSAALHFTVTNSGVQGDKLVSISSPAAQKVTLKGAQDIPGGSSVVATDSSASGANPQAVTLSATLEGLTAEVKPGPTFPVTFTFARSGTLTLPVPVATPETPRGASSHG